MLLGDRLGVGEPVGRPPDDLERAKGVVGAVDLADEADDGRVE